MFWFEDDAYVSDFTVLFGVINPSLGCRSYRELSVSWSLMRPKRKTGQVILVPLPTSYKNGANLCHRQPPFEILSIRLWRNSAQTRSQPQTLDIPDEYLPTSRFVFQIPRPIGRWHWKTMEMFRIRSKPSLGILRSFIEGLDLTRDYRQTVYRLMCRRQGPTSQAEFA